MKKLLNISDLEQSDFINILKYADALNNQNAEVLTKKKYWLNI